MSFLETGRIYLPSKSILTIFCGKLLAMPKSHILLTMLVYENITWFDVPMDDVCTVHVLGGAEKVVEDYFEVLRGDVLASFWEGL